MPRGPFGGPRPFANDETQVLLDIKLFDPASDEEFSDIPEDAEGLSQVKIEDILAGTGILRRRIYIGRRTRNTNSFRAIITYGDMKLTVPEAASISEDVKQALDSFYRPILEEAGRNPSPFVASWKCSTVPSLVSGEDLNTRVERSAKRAMDNIRSGVSGKGGVPRPFANPTGLTIEYRMNINISLVDAQQIKTDVLEMETGKNIPTHEDRISVESSKEGAGGIRFLIDKGSSGMSYLDAIAINREMSKRVGRIDYLEIEDSFLTCGK